MSLIQNWLQEFINVTEEEIIAINEITETTMVKTNEVILKQGDISDKIGLLVKGSVRTYFTDKKGNEKIVFFAFDGEPIAAIGSFFNQTPSSVTTVTLENSIIIWTDHARYISFVNKFPQYNTVILTALTRWFSEGKNRMEYLHQTSAKAKYDSMCKVNPKIIERVPLKYIASYLGITQETLSRIRRKK